ncbi:MAG: hypothetical protein AAB347_07720 [Bacteroidota bacterium]
MEKRDDLRDKVKQMAGQAEKLIDEGFDKAKDSFVKAKGSETYSKISGLMDEVGEYVDKKIVELKKSDLPDQMENFRKKAEARSETIVDQAKAYGNLIAGDIEEVIGNVKDKLKGKGEKK